MTLQVAKSNGEVKTDQETQGKSTSRIDEAAGFLTASLDSLTPALVQRMVVSMAQMTELADLLNNEEMKSLLARTAEVADSLERSLGAIKDLEESGALKALVEMGEFANAMKQSLTSSLVIRSLADVGLLAAEMGDRMLEAARDAKSEAEQDTRKIGPMTLLNALKDPKTQEGLKFLLAMGRRLPDVLESL